MVRGEHALEGEVIFLAGRDGIKFQNFQDPNRSVRSFG